MAKGADTSRVGALYEKAKKSLKLHDIFCFFDSIESNDDEDKVCIVTSSSSFV